MTIAARLLRWYDKAGRTLPWRGTRDPYRILVSEIMLQQTQVQRVILFYQRWLEQFPDWQTLAHASNADVIHAWAGLGYNRRALMLREIARTITKQGLPKTEEEWLALKGIGPYTAAALTVFSLHKPAVPIDTNIRRTASRLLLGTPFPDPKNDERLKKHLQQNILAHKRFQDIPQALFDLATLICTKTPSCAQCPLRTECKAAPLFLSGRVQTPRAMMKKPNETKHRNKPSPDRIYRGRILGEIRKATNGLTATRLGPLVDPAYDQTQDEAWLLRMCDRLKRDQFIIQKGRRWFLFDTKNP